MGCVAGGRVHDSAVPMEPRRAPSARNASSQSSSSSLSSRPPCLGLQCYLHPTDRFSTFPGNFSFVPPFPPSGTVTHQQQEVAPPTACIAKRYGAPRPRELVCASFGGRGFDSSPAHFLTSVQRPPPPCDDGESGRGSQVPQPARSGRLGVQRFGTQTRWLFCGAGRRRRDRT